MIGIKNEVKNGGNKIFTSPADCKIKLEGYFNTYLAGNDEEIADIESLAEYLGCTRKQLLVLEGDEVYGQYIARAKNSIARIKKQMAMKGKIPASVLSFDMKNNHDYTDKGDTVSDEPQIIIIDGDAKHWCK